MKSASIRRSAAKNNPIFSFKPTLFRQPSLTEDAVDLPSFENEGESLLCSLEDCSYDSMESSAIGSGDSYDERSKRWSNRSDLSMPSFDLSPVGEVSPLEGGSLAFQMPSSRSPRRPEGEENSRRWNQNDSTNYRQTLLFSPNGNESFNATPITNQLQTTIQRDALLKANQREGRNSSTQFNPQNSISRTLVGSDDSSALEMTQARKRESPRAYVYELDEATPMLTSETSQVRYWFAVDEPHLLFLNKTESRYPIPLRCNGKCCEKKLKERVKRNQLNSVLFNNFGT